MLLTEKALRQFAKSLLFESEDKINLNEVFQPDDMFPQQKLNYGGHFHQAGPDPEKDKEKLEQALEDLPVEPTEQVSSAQVAYSVPTKILDNPKENIPTSLKQFALSMGATIDNSDLTNAQIKKAWLAMNKILKKVTEEGK